MVVNKYLMLQDCFSFFPHLPDLDFFYAEEAKNSTQFTTYHVVPISGIRVNTTQAPTAFESTQFMQDLRAEFGHARTHYLRVDGMHSYDWHTDSARKAAILFLLNDVGTAFTLFRQPIDERNSHILPVPYTLLRPTLLDVSVSHCVINLTTQPRYALTVGFSLDVTYKDVKQYLNQYQTTKY